MVNSAPPEILPTWGQAIAQPATEFPLQPLPILAGQIPPTLQGSLYRNGPGRLSRGQQRVGHWFDGDGAILAVHLADGQAQGVYRYVQTAGYLAENQADRFLYINYGMKGAGWLGALRSVKNAANTSVLALPDRLLALWEGGRPHALDLTDLHTIGLDDLGTGNFKMPYSAHPKVDPHTGEIFNFGVSIGSQITLDIYGSDRQGRVQRQRSIPLPGAPVIHDFALAGPYLVFCISPVRISLLPVLFNLKSVSDAIRWRPELGTQILVVDRQTLAPLPLIETDPWFQWHFGNGYLNDQQHIVIDLVRYADFQTNLFLQDVASGQTERAVAGQLWQLIIDPQGPRIVSNKCLVESGCDFPVPAQLGQPGQTYLSMQKQGVNSHRELLGDIAVYDDFAETLIRTTLPPHLYAGEPLPVQDWVLATVYDGRQNSSEVWIWERQQLATDPVCRVGLPTVVPMGFHGTWRSLAQ